MFPNALDTNAVIERIAQLVRASPRWEKKLDSHGTDARAGTMEADAGRWSLHLAQQTDVG
jgi:hypothetical protein